MKDIYIFGSIVRGEVDQYSDIDLLMVTSEAVYNIDLNKYSIYTPERIKELYIEGNPFAWHLYYESKLVYTSGANLLENLGKPSNYVNCKTDLLKFKNLFEASITSIIKNRFSIIFDLAMVFLALRNFATCYTLGNYTKPVFSRQSFEKLDDYPLILDSRVKEMLMMSRISSIRGINYQINDELLNLFLSDIERINKWFLTVLKIYESRV
ncbi:nucleotidyltransferase domain-containing protein [Leeuwenhoekiella parthenopeia]|uniref:Nucleotidyltransferase domain-containing protein n=1 Tax=Leeuwenhoekiella parthenopeia TaxID=2890320 RepID=A0ABS8GVL1_9FLAO|nr:nucleotidyltransferase domain-containing protein [Leeuwenhoekiella parthenopeia]MCC4213969.1 nucleotidyltransferase domain-containing protein [Leeuwenhoekiella parthenopeia]